MTLHTSKHRIAKACALAAGLTLASLQAWAGADAALYIAKATGRNKLVWR